MTINLPQLTEAQFDRFMVFLEKEQAITREKEEAKNQAIVSAIAIAKELIDASKK